MQLSCIFASLKKAYFIKMEINSLLKGSGCRIELWVGDKGVNENVAILSWIKLLVHINS